MNARLFLSALSAMMIFAGCAQHHEYAWIKGGGSNQDRDRDLKAAHAEAMNAYPSTAKLKNPPKDPRKAEEKLSEMRRSVQALYMASHGWHLAYYTNDGRLLSAEHEH